MASMQLLVILALLCSASPSLAVGGRRLKIVNGKDAETNRSDTADALPRQRGHRAQKGTQLLTMPMPAQEPLLCVPPACCCLIYAGALLRRVYHRLGGPVDHQ